MRFAYSLAASASRSIRNDKRATFVTSAAFKIRERREPHWRVTAATHYVARLATFALIFCSFTKSK
jgi:hypothetical protein